MDRELAELLRRGAKEFGLDLDSEALARFATYLDLLQLWGRKFNLSSRLRDREVVIHHFLDSLAGAPLFQKNPSARVIDIGAGAGFPSLPLKIALPELEVLLVESQRKKVSFIKEVIRGTKLSCARALWARAEEAGEDSELQGAFGWCVSRAVAGSAQVVRYAKPFLGPGGRVLLYKGAPGQAELADLGRTCISLGASSEVVRTVVPGLASPRSLVLVTMP